ncbi:MAG: GAF and ANTAR domain-containing protein [Nocardioidaceae bacterium]|nr:GAF and ANTAR domain-containing protein [Nocardioidaceae bacterium]
MTENAQTFATPPDSVDLATAFQRLSVILYACTDFDEVYQTVCSAAPNLVTGCDRASLMLIRNGQRVTVGASDEIAARVDAFERELGEGPCVDAIQDESAFIDPDLTDGTPWPRLAAQVLKHTPVRGMAGFRLMVNKEKTGALNLFSDTAGQLTNQSVNEAILLTSFVSVTLTAAHHREDALTLRAGLESNREIGKAVGLMMAFHKISDDEAFAKLRQASQDMNVKITEIAREVVSHHNARGN